MQLETPLPPLSSLPVYLSTYISHTCDCNYHDEDDDKADMSLFVLRFIISTVNQKGKTQEIPETPPDSLAHIEMDGQTRAQRALSATRPLYHDQLFNYVFSFSMKIYTEE